MQAEVFGRTAGCVKMVQGEGKNVQGTDCGRRQGDKVYAEEV
jgi:hypothetical protein